MFKIILNNCCGLDVHKTRIYACIGITDTHSRTEYCEANFSSFPTNLTVSSSNSAGAILNSITIYYGVSDIDVTGVTLSPNTEQTIDVGDKVSFTAAIAPNDATNKKVKWSVNNIHVALYSNEACTTAVGTDATDTLTVYAKGVSAGSATVTVTATNGTDVTTDDQSASCSVTVKALDPVKYLDASGTQQSCDSYTVVLNGDTSKWSNATYVLKDSAEITDWRKGVSGMVNLILCDGATLTIPRGFFVDNTATLNIFAGSTGETVQGTGALLINGVADNRAGIGGGNNGSVGAGNITINGGNITVTGGANAAGIGGGYDSVHSTGTAGGTVTINGGTVTATGGEGAVGIGGGKDATDNGTLTLGADVGMLVSDDNSNWTAYDGSTRKQYMKTYTHTHSFNYSVRGATITATCNADGCTLDDGTEQHKHAVTLTIVKPTLTTYGQTGEGISAEATLDGLENFNTATGLNVQTSSIVYWNAKIQEGEYKTDGDQPLTAAPTSAGNYLAKITVNNCIASVGYTIVKADPTANAPTGLTATYGQTLANVSLEGKNPQGNTPGTWAWADAATTSVGSVGAHTFKANFTPTDTTNYNSQSNVDVTVTVGKADNPATVTSTATVTKGGNTVDLAGNVTLNGATGAISYAIDGEAKGCTLNGSVLTSGDTTGTVTVNVTVATDDNYNALAATPITVTISDKGTQTITAENVTATYGDTDKAVSATVTEPATGGGDISYAVKEGSADCISVNESTGALTINAVPADGKAYVVVTAAETQTYAQATKEVTVTINKANAVAATVTANNRTFDSTEKPLVTVDNATLAGGTMWYALGENATTAPADNLYTTSIPAKTNAGTYYVWYKAVGDANHNDSEPKAVTVVIAEPNTYIVTVTNDGNGTGTAAPASGVEGTEVTLTNTPAAGYQFKEWQVISGGVTVANNQFTIGTANVEVKAVFEAQPAGSETGNTETKPGAPVLGATNMDEVVKSVVDAIKSGKLTGVKDEVKQALSQPGAIVTLTLVSKPLADNEIPAQDKNALDRVMQTSGYDGYAPFDLSLLLTVKNPATGETVTEYLHASSKEVTFTLNLPDNLKKAGRTFFLLHTANGTTNVVRSAQNPGPLSGSSSDFSTYAIAYKDAVAAERFTFKKVWMGGREDEINFKVYYPDGKAYDGKVNKDKVTGKKTKEWTFDLGELPVGCYVVEEPVAGYTSRCVNVGEHAADRNRCYNGGTIMNMKVPKTGDTANFALWIGMLAVGLAGIATILVIGKRGKARK